MPLRTVTRHGAPERPGRPPCQRADRVLAAPAVTVLVLLLSILVVGFIATLGIPLEIFPRGYTGQHLHVYIPWPNAPAQQVLDDITLPLEEELSTVRGLKQVNSWSAQHGCSVFLEFKHGTPMDVAYREVRDRIQRARLRFPTDVERVFIRKEDASGIPVAVIGMAMDPGLTDPYTLLQREVIQPLERIDGVANVTWTAWRKRRSSSRSTANWPKPTA
jgi:hydrophobic/amphiphilic exporter-1 (mainly G- bacteria), HAE1 family